MVAAVTSIAALLLSVALLLMGNGLLGTLLPIRANMENFSALDIGVLGSAYFLGFAVGCISGAHIVSRAGHIRTFTAMAAIASSVVLGHALIQSPVIWWSLRAVTGLCFAVLYIVIESWLNEKSTNANRGLVFSIYTIINLTVVTLGQLMLILDEPSGFSLFALASIIVSLAAVPIALTRAQAPAPIKAVKIRLRYLYARSPVGVTGCLAVGLANGSFWTLGPVFALTEQSGLMGVALFMSVTVMAGAIGQWPLGRLSDGIDRRKVIIFACIGAAAAGLGMVFFGQAWDRAILAFAFLFGFFSFPVYALSVAHMNDFVEPKGYVEAASGLLLVYAAGAVVGPLLASIVVKYLGVSSLFGYTAAVHLATAGFVVYRMQIRVPALEEEHISFADALRVAQTVSAIDPFSSAPLNETSRLQPEPVDDPEHAG